ncbi:hypothetical protein N7G274_002903 [Stereocaulon virgatum]|uniref:CS domain-containing protein n=1 Tax=Stereocaulon virgatum TaxID=373712 RepID=A0ABR4AL87_9LECA
MSETIQTTPEVIWAQRSSKTDAEKNYILLTIAAPDVPDKSFKVDLKPTSLTFTGHSETKKQTYHVELRFYDEIDVEKSQTHHTSRDVMFKLRKKTMKEEYWPRLLKDTKKMHFLKTDFDKWVDEDEQDAAPDDDMGGMDGMGGMGGMPGMGGDGGFGGIDFSKLGSGASDMPDMGELGGEEDEDDDGEMPGLEGEEGDAEEGKGKGKEVEAKEVKPAAKIEEVS